MYPPGTKPQPSCTTSDTWASSGCAAAQVTRPLPVASAVESPATTIRTGRGGTGAAVTATVVGTAVVVTAEVVGEGPATELDVAVVVEVVTEVVVVDEVVDVAAASGASGATGVVSIAACAAAAVSTA